MATKLRVASLISVYDLPPLEEEPLCATASKGCRVSRKAIVRGRRLVLLLAGECASLGTPRTPLAAVGQSIRIREAAVTVQA